MEFVYKFQIVVCVYHWWYKCQEPLSEWGGDGTSGSSNVQIFVTHCILNNLPVLVLQTLDVLCLEISYIYKY